jgi:riboflavin biosynthesis pyrimidine reductase
MHVIWYTAMSMDGRIADAQGSLEFLTTIGSRAGGEDEFSSFLATIDAVLVGAGTLRWLLHHGHGWPHDDLPTWLVSHDDTLVSQIGATRAPFRRVEGPLAQAFDEMATAGHDRVWLCGGGDIAGQTLAIDRLDEVLITVAPTALGAGPALFDGAGLPRRRFRLVECRALGGHAARLGWSRDRDC